MTLGYGEIPQNAGRVEDVRIWNALWANSTNDRGMRTFEWRPWETDGRQREGVVFDNPQSTLYYRHPHEVCGGHAHTGENPHDPDRYPEEIRFILGLVWIDCEDLWGNQRSVPVNAEHGRPVMVSIPPWIFHTFRIYNEWAIYEEMRRVRFSRNPAEQDLVYEDEFRARQQALRA